MIFGPGHDNQTKLPGHTRAIHFAALLTLHICGYAAAAVLVPSGSLDDRVLEALIFATLLIAASLVDVQRFEIPDTVSGLLFLFGAFSVWQAPVHLQLDKVTAGIVLPSTLFLTGYVYARWRGHPGLGLGDVKLVAGLGLWLGLQKSIWMLLAASLSGIFTLLIVSSVRQLPKSTVSTSGVAFAPFLCLSAWVIWL